MSNLGNKAIMSRNLQYFMNVTGKDRKQICSDLDIKYTTFTDWVKGNKYPRIDKIELLANYFGINKSDLIEEKPAPQQDKLSQVKRDLMEYIKSLDDETAQALLVVARTIAGQRNQ